jgi:hypothetical protein
MNGPLSTATIVASLALAVWYLVRAVLNRAPSRFDLAGMVVLAALVAALVAAVAVRLAGGFRPAETVTLIGYLITTVAFPPVGWQLARMEPTRWGLVILVVACLTMPVLVVRLQHLAGT